MLAGTCSPPRSNTAAWPRITFPVPPGATTARVIPSTRVTGITVEKGLKASTTLNAALRSFSVVALIRRPFGDSADFDDADAGGRLDPSRA